jgi:hypothetical protein
MISATFFNQLNAIDWGPHPAMPQKRTVSTRNRIAAWWGTQNGLLDAAWGVGIANPQFLLTPKFLG